MKSILLSLALLASCSNQNEPFLVSLKLNTCDNYEIESPTNLRGSLRVLADMKCEQNSYESSYMYEYSYECTLDALASYYCPDGSNVKRLRCQAYFKCI